MMEPLVLDRRRLSRRRALQLAPLALLADCGFKPLYPPTGRAGVGADGAAAGAGGPGRLRAEMAAVQVDLIPDRPGQLLRQALQARLGSDGADAHRYELLVGYGISGEGVGVLTNNSTTRLRLVGHASWSLRGLGPGNPTLTNGSARSLDAYNVINQQYFASDLENEVSQRRLADTIADHITVQLAAFFDHRAAPGG